MVGEHSIREEPYHFDHIRNFKPEFRERLVNVLVSKYGESHPHITRKHYDSWLQGPLGNSFTVKGIMNWMKDTMPKMTPSTLESIENFPNFFLAETHTEEWLGYVPLAQNDNFPVAA